MSRPVKLACAYSGYAFVVLFLVGFVPIAGFVPPPRPTETAAQIAARFHSDHDAIQIGMALCVLASALLLPWGAAVAEQMRRIEHRGRALTYSWLTGNALLTILFIYPCLWWAVGGFRPGSDPAVIQSLNDMAWLGFMGIISTAIVQAIVLGVAVLGDRSGQPVFPRWFGYFQLWCAVLALPDAVVFIFHDGPLAWNGLLSFWMVCAMAITWLILTTAMTARAIKSAPDESSAAAGVEARLAAIEARLGSDLASV